MMLHQNRCLRYHFNSLSYHLHFTAQNYYGTDYNYRNFCGRDFIVMVLREDSLIDLIAFDLHSCVFLSFLNPDYYSSEQGF